MKEKIKTQNGITLIALVVTIIIMLILAAVTINLAINGGLFSQAQRAVDEMENAIGYEENLINEMYNFIGDNTSNSPEENPVETPEGNYVVDETTYCNTLTEALELAQEGSIIKIIKDTEQAESITIDKSVTINTNGKTLTFAEGKNITVNENKNVTIEGNGTISGDPGMSFIINSGNLVTNNVTIIGNPGGGAYNTVMMYEGTLITNNSNINGITSYTTTTINGGEYGRLHAGVVGSGIYEINNATIESLDLLKGGTAVINSGTVETISLGWDSGDIYLTIGNINENVNNTNPEIGIIEVYGMGVSPESVLNFYNGIIKENTVGGDFATDEMYIAYVVTPRSGYTVQATTEGSILVQK